MKNIVIAVVVSAVVAFIVASLVDNRTAAPTQKETAYERVMRTGTIRCGYAIYEPLLGKDAKTGALHGVFYDLVNEMGRELDLKIDWATEVGYGEIEEGFQTGKYDMFCNGVIPTPKRAKFSLITTPVFYGGLLAWVRTDDHRFDDHPERLNTPDVTLVVRDGDINATVAQTFFPLAKTLSSPQLEEYSQMLVDVVTKKGDAVFFEKSFADNFLAKNPGSIRSAAPDKPVDVHPVSMMLPIGEVQFKNMIDTTLTKLILSGAVKQAIEKNGETSAWFIKAPYEIK
jgi:polar amino acid transport system substrate-binding protein